MVRKVIIAKSKNISLQLPEDFVGKQVEVIAFTLEDESVMEELENIDKTATHLASHKILANDWLNPVEDKAWEDL